MIKILSKHRALLHLCAGIYSRPQGRVAGALATHFEGGRNAGSAELSHRLRAAEAEANALINLLHDYPLAGRQ